MEKASHTAFLNAFPRLKVSSNQYVDQSIREQCQLMEDEYIKIQNAIQIIELIRDIKWGVIDGTKHFAQVTMNDWKKNAKQFLEHWKHSTIVW